MAGQNGLCRHIPSNSIQSIVRVGRNDAGMERAQQRGPLFFRFWVSKNDIIKTRHAHMEHTHSSAWCAVLFRWNIYLDRCKCLPATFFTCSPSTCSCSLDFLNDSFVFFSRLLPSEWISIFYPSFRDLLPLNNWLRICFRFLFGTYLQYVHHIYLFLSGNSFFLLLLVWKHFRPGTPLWWETLLRPSQRWWRTEETIAGMPTCSFVLLSYHKAPMKIVAMRNILFSLDKWKQFFFSYLLSAFLQK